MVLNTIKSLCTIVRVQIRSRLAFRLNILVYFDKLHSYVKSDPVINVFLPAATELLSSWLVLNFLTFSTRVLGRLLDDMLQEPEGQSSQVFS